MKATDEEILKIIRKSYTTGLTRIEFERAREALGECPSDVETLNPEIRIELALLLGRRGVDPFTISRVLNWRDFESLVQKACEENGYRTTRNLRIKKPRTEIDVLAISSDSKIALCIDCKHWARTAGGKTIDRIVELQVERARRFLWAPSLQTKPDFAVPVITTLLDDESVRSSSDVPIVPIFRFKDFLLNLRGNLNLLRLVRKNPNCQGADSL